jgi:hypothetical protein
MTQENPRKMLQLCAPPALTGPCPASPTARFRDCSALRSTARHRLRMMPHRAEGRPSPQRICGVSFTVSMGGRRRLHGGLMLGRRFPRHAVVTFQPRRKRPILVSRRKLALRPRNNLQTHSPLTRHDRQSGS